MFSVDLIRKHITGIVQGVDGLYTVIITDRDGVPLFKMSVDHAPEVPIRPHMLAMHGLALEQSAKMGLGEVKHVACVYNQYQLVLLNYGPLLVTLIGSAEANTGLMIGLHTELEPIVRQLQQVTVDAMWSKYSIDRIEKTFDLYCMYFDKPKNQDYDGSLWVLSKTMGEE